MTRNTIFFSLIFILYMYVGMPQSIAQKSGVQQESQKNNVKKIELIVTGMSCQKGCADGIDKKLNMTFGVVRSKTNFEKGKSVVTYDPSLISIAEIIKVIKDKGYEAKLK